MRCLAALGALAVVILVAGGAEAEEALERPGSSSDAEDPSEAVVLITMAGDPDPDATEATLKDLFADVRARPVRLVLDKVPEIDPTWITHPPGERAPAFARVWIDVQADACVVSIADASWERIYVRRIPRPDGADVVTREQIGHVIVSAIEALLAGGKIGVAREELEEPARGGDLPPPAPPLVVAPTPSPPPRPPKRELKRELVGRLAVGYEALAFATRRTAHGPWASLRGGVRGERWSVGLELSGQWRAPVSVSPEPIGVRIDTKALRLVVDAERRVDPRLAFRAGVGPGLDVAYVEPRGASTVSPVDGEPIVTVEAGRERISPVLRFTVGVDVRVARSFDMRLAAVLDHDLANGSYFVRHGGDERVVLAPFSLRPGLTLAIVADLGSTGLTSAPPTAPYRADPPPTSRSDR